MFTARSAESPTISCEATKREVVAMQTFRPTLISPVITAPTDDGGWMTAPQALLHLYMCRSPQMG